MRITINGEAEEYTEGSLSIRAILDSRHWSFPLIIAKRNGQLIQRDDYGACMVEDGDALELYHLISGG
jgi:thiamine biosynthesis protein ThiS